MTRSPPSWFPSAGTLVSFTGTSSRVARSVRVVAEARSGRMVVEAIGRQGLPVRLTVKRENLRPLPPGLFD